MGWMEAAKTYNAVGMPLADSITSLSQNERLALFQSENYCRNPEGKFQQPSCYVEVVGKLLPVLSNVGCSLSHLKYCPSAAAAAGPAMPAQAMNPNMGMGVNPNVNRNMGFAINPSVVNAQCKQKDDRKGYKYDGELAQTNTGARCVNWRAVKDSKINPNFRKYEMKLRGTGGLEHAYCRNPDNDEGGPWCFTSISRTQGKNYASCGNAYSQLPECAPQPAGMMKTNAGGFMKKDDGEDISDVAHMGDPLAEVYTGDA